MNASSCLNLVCWFSHARRWASRRSPAACGTPVVARVLDQPPALVGDGLDLDDPADHGVEQVAVVADHQHRAAELVGEEALEPLPALDIEVVGRLVEQQDVGLASRIFASASRARCPPERP
jgi:hypothetical protein